MNTEYFVRLDLNIIRDFPDIYLNYTEFTGKLITRLENTFVFDIYQGIMLIIPYDWIYYMRPLNEIIVLDEEEKKTNG